MNARPSRREKVLNDYRLLLNDLTKQQNNIRSYFNFIKEERIQAKAEHINELEVFLNLSNFVVKQNEADYINIAKVAESADFIKKQSDQVKHIIEDVSTEKKWKDYLNSQDIASTFPLIDFDNPSRSLNLHHPYSEKAYFILSKAAKQATTKETIYESVSKVKKEYKFTRDAISHLHDKCTKIEDGALNSLKPFEATDEIMDHYKALADAQISSNELINIAEILKDQTTPEQENEKTFFKKLWDKIKHGWESFTEKIKHIGEVFFGAAKALGNEILKGLEKLKDSFKEGKDIVLKAFKWVAEKFQELILKIINSMLDFLSRFRVIVKEKGYSVSKIEIKIPSIKFEFKNIFGLIPVPLPKIDPPDLTVTIEPEKLPEKQAG